MKSSKRLKVLMITTSYPSDYDPVSGVFFREHAQAISLYDDVTLICSYSDPSKCLQLRKPVKVKDNIENGVRTIRMEFPRISNKIDAAISMLLVLYAGFRIKEKSQFDIIHAQKFFPSGILSVILARLYRVPFVVCEHSGNFMYTMRTILRKISTRYAMKKAIQVITVSRVLSASIKSCVPQLNIRVISNPVNTRRFSPSDNKNSKYPIKKILHISHLRADKGIGYLIDAASRLKRKRTDFVIDIVGGSPDNLKRAQNFAETYQVNRIIRFYSKKSHDDIANFVRDCVFFVLPSIRESFGVVLIEAMACGKPIIATRCGGPKEIVTEETGILIPPGNVDALVKAMDYMLDNYQKYDSKAIRNYVKNNFSYEVIGRKIDRVYRKILDKL